MFYKISELLIVSVLIAQTSWSKTSKIDFLKKWEQNPQAVSDEVPVKEGAEVSYKFSQQDIRNQKFIDQKIQYRLEQCLKSGQGECEQKISPLEMSEDRTSIQKFLGRIPEINIYKLDAYKIGAAQVTPWSGSYWPYNQGGIGMRYSDKQFPHSSDFIDNLNYYEQNYGKDSSLINNLDILSPAEKYDLLIDDKNWTLTHNSWEAGRRLYKDSGKILRWMGICDGWAPAAMIVPEPKKSFSVHLPHLGRTVKFFPDDIKALVSQLWASANVPSEMIGGRCNTKSPIADLTGHIISSKCFDVNPATWHLVLLNMVGMNRESFIFDSTYDYEVWNQPISSYSLSYFNPSSKENSNNLKDVMIPYSDFSGDWFRFYRSSGIESIVGVELKLKYTVESKPKQASGVASPRFVQVTYHYDLEIDKDGNVIGGEWYQRAHPDMIWKPKENKAIVAGEPRLSSWSDFLPIPLDVATFAKMAAKSTQPINAILDKLLLLSSGAKK